MAEVVPLTVGMTEGAVVVAYAKTIVTGRVVRQHVTDFDRGASRQQAV